MNEEKIEIIEDIIQHFQYIIDDYLDNITVEQLKKVYTEEGINVKIIK